MIADGIGLTIDSFEAIYTTGGTEVLEIYAGLNYTDPVYSSDMTIVGCPPLLFTANGRPLKDYTILGNSYQDGVPDPDNPVEVVSVGEKMENLYNKNSDENIHGYINSNGTPIVKDYGPAVLISHKIPVVPGKTYALCNAISGGTGNFACFYRADDTPISAFPVVAKANYIKTAPQGSAYFRTTVIFKNDENDCMFVEGTTVPASYIPYGYKIPVTVSDGTNSQTYPIYLSEPLRKIGDYADEIDFKAGTVTRRVKEVVLTGNESNWFVYDVTYYRAFAGIPPTVYEGTAVCNAFIYKRSIIPPINLFSKGVNENLVFNYDANGRNLSAFKAWLSQLYANGNPVIVYHILSTPTTEQITLPTIATLNGTNTLSIDTTLPPSQLSITGHVKPSSSYGNLTDKNGTYILDKNNVQIQTIG